MKTFIYILIDPETQEVRYIGKSNNPKQRLKNHCNPARFRPTHKFNWIKSLRNKNLKPIMEIIDEVDIEEWKFWEQYWISQFKTWGFKLVNYCDGGQGLSYGNQTSFKKGNKAFNDTNTYITCQNCGNQFKVSPSRIGVRKYCSRQCNSESRKGKTFTNSGSFKKESIPWNKGLKYKIK